LVRIGLGREEQRHDLALAVLARLEERRHAGRADDIRVHVG
jgi:hypothetical protein